MLPPYTKNAAYPQQLFPWAQGTIDRTSGLGAVDASYCHGGICRWLVERGLAPTGMGNEFAVGIVIGGGVVAGALAGVVGTWLVMRKRRGRR